MSLSSLQLDAFFQLAQSKNFSLAAKRLHITQSALSQRIQKLEDELKSALFIRNPKNLKLTPLGHELLKYCQAKSSLEEEFLKGHKNSFSHKLGGTVRIAGFSSVLGSVVIPALHKLARDSNDTIFEFSSAEMRAIPGLLDSGEVDFILLDRKIERQGILSVLLGYEENVMVQAKDATKRNDVFLDHDFEDPTTAAFFQAQTKKNQAFQRCFFDEINLVIEGVLFGYGRAIVPLHIVRQRKELEVVPGYKPLKTAVYLCHFAQLFYSRLHNTVLETLRKESAKILSSST